MCFDPHNLGGGVLVSLVLFMAIIIPSTQLHILVKSFFFLKKKNHTKPRHFVVSRPFVWFFVFLVVFVLFFFGSRRSGRLRKKSQYGLHTDSSILPLEFKTVGELLWLPSASTPSLWLGKLGFKSVLPLDVVVHGGSILEGERSPPGTMGNWYDPEEVP